MRMPALVLAFVSLLVGSTAAAAAVLNVEFHFAPFTGDQKNSTVQTVPGKATVFINNVMVAEVPVEKRDVPVIFDDREIAAPVWAPMASMGPVLRKGKNKFRVEFVPTDAKAQYKTQFRWASVMDKATSSKTASGATLDTNQAGVGSEVKPASGKVVLEREFVADFAADLPWHHYAPVTTISDEDKKRLAALVSQRTEVFKPNFAGAYEILKTNKNVMLAEVQKLKCLDAAYAAGVRAKAPTAQDLDFATTGNPEVMVSSRKGELYSFDEKAFERIKGNDQQGCAGMMMTILYPARLMAVRAPSGEWQVVY